MESYTVNEESAVYMGKVLIIDIHIKTSLGKKTPRTKKLELTSLCVYKQESDIYTHSHKH